MDGKFNFDSFVVWVFCGLVSGCFVYGVNLLAKLNESIRELHQTIARLLEKTAWHEKELIKHDERITRLEEKNKNCNQ